MFKKKPSIKKVIGHKELGQWLISMQINGEKDYSCENIGPIRTTKNYFEKNNRFHKKASKNIDRMINANVQQEDHEKLLEYRRERFLTFEDLINYLRIEKMPDKLAYNYLERFLLREENKSYSKNLGITRVYSSLKSIPEVNLSSEDFKDLFQQYYRRKDITITDVDLGFLTEKYVKGKNDLVKRFTTDMPKLEIYIKNNEVENVQELLKNFNYSINYLGRRFKNPLLFATRNDRLDVVKKLLDYPEINVNLQPYDDNTALIIAVGHNKIDIVKQLLDYEDIDVNLPRHSQTPLMLAVIYKKIDIVKELLKHPKIKVNLQTDDGVTALMYAVLANNVECVNELLGHGADVNAHGNTDTALMLAAKYGHLAILKKLLERGADVNVHGPNTDDFNGSQTALIIAVYKNHVECVNELLRYGADGNAQDKYGYTALIWAVRNNYLDIVKKLLEYPERINVNFQDKYGFTALIWAAQKGNKYIVKELLQPSFDDSLSVYEDAEDSLSVYKDAEDSTYGADGNVQDKYGDTALIWAVKKGHLDVVKEILDYPEINVNLQDDDGYTAIIWAVKMYSVDIVLDLVERPGINVNLQREYGHIDAREIRLDIVKELVQRKGIDVNLQDLLR